MTTDAQKRAIQKYMNDPEKYQRHKERVKAYNKLRYEENKEYREFKKTYELEKYKLLKALE